MGEQTSLEFDLTFGNVLLHKLIQAYNFNMLSYYIDLTSLHSNMKSIGYFG